jgi:L-ornithine N5-oxygenase
MSTSTQILDVLGIGFGPANIALAIALEELAPALTVRFVKDDQYRSGSPTCYCQARTSRIIPCVTW